MSLELPRRASHCAAANKPCARRRQMNGECLEANFDACAAFGFPLAPKLRSPGSDPPVPIGCR